MYAGGWTASSVSLICADPEVEGRFDCALYLYEKSVSVTAEYCDVPDPPFECEDRGVPNTAGCYGLTSFAASTACWADRGYLPIDYGAIKMNALFQLMNSCDNYRCPEGALLNKDMGQNKGADSDPYDPDTWID